MTLHQGIKKSDRIQKWEISPSDVHLNVKTQLNELEVSAPLKNISQLG
jgi:hypothetical protein